MVHDSTKCVLPGKVGFPGYLVKEAQALVKILYSMIVKPGMTLLSTGYLLHDSSTCGSANRSATLIRPLIGDEKLTELPPTELPPGWLRV